MVLVRSQIRSRSDHSWPVDRYLATEITHTVAPRTIVTGAGNVRRLTCNYDANGTMATCPP